MTKFSTISLYLTKLYFAIVSSVTYSGFRCPSCQLAPPKGLRLSLFKCLLSSLNASLAAYQPNKLILSNKNLTISKVRETLKYSTYVTLLYTVQHRYECVYHLLWVFIEVEAGGWCAGPPLAPPTATAAGYTIAVADMRKRLRKSNKQWRHMGTGLIVL